MANSATSLCVVLLLTSCAHTAAVSDSYCSVAKTIVASRKDTAGTLAQVRVENAKIRKLCWGMK